MANNRLLDSARAALVVVDVQEAFRGVVEDFGSIAERISIAVQGFQILERPIFVTEQYPKGLGRTAEEITVALPQKCEYFEKSSFSSCGAAGFEDKLRTAGISQVVLCGLETHVCVNQTAHDVLDRGFAVHLLTDCVASRYDRDKQAGLAKMFSSGVVPSSVEMALFEMMRNANHEKFGHIQKLIK